ncbi:hypothetical protein Bca101_062024 [Brassica carinata]
MANSRVFYSITNVDSPEKISTSGVRCEVEAEDEKKEGPKKTWKTVRFNLNVQTFEPTLPSSLEDEYELGYGESDFEDEEYNKDDENDYEDDADDEEDEDQNVTPLLNPDENIAQWKAVKAKPVRRVKQLMKENVEADNDNQAKPLIKEIIVNTSLADWFGLTKDFSWEWFV